MPTEKQKILFIYISFFTYLTSKTDADDNHSRANEIHANSFEGIFKNEALETHNKLRSRHGIPPLTHNEELSRIATDWARVIADLDNIEHSKNTYNNESLGENIAVLRSPNMNVSIGIRVTNIWYDEIKKYKFNHPDLNPENAHFTQVIWKSSREVGFGIAMSKSGKFYVVANYFPAGNFKPNLNYEVLPLNKTEQLFSCKFLLLICLCISIYLF